jgi:hypothetical protein
MLVRRIEIDAVNVYWSESGTVGVGEWSLGRSEGVAGRLEVSTIGMLV